MRLVESLGGGLDYVLSPVAAVDDDFVPDVLAVVRYPSRQVFDDMMASDEYRAFAHLRTECCRADDPDRVPEGVPVSDLPGAP